MVTVDLSVSMRKEREARELASKARVPFTTVTTFPARPRLGKLKTTVCCLVSYDV